MSGIGDTLDRIEALIARRIRAVAPFRAVVTAVDGGLISIKRVGAATADERKYASLTRRTLNVNDEVLCVNLNGEPVVVDRIRRAAAATPTATNTPVGTYAAAGASPGSATVVGTDEGVDVSFMTGTTPAAGSIFKVNFAATRASANFGVICLPRGTNAKGTMPYLVSRGTDGYTIGVATAPSAGVTVAYQCFARDLIST